MFLKEIEEKPATGLFGLILRKMKASGAEIPQIFHLIRFKTRATRHLGRFTQEVMRGPSPLTAGTRELIAAFVSSRNQCVF